ncbi:MAG: transposase [Verrucomicrobiota bacterium]
MDITRKQRKLPHWTREGATYAVTFRLHDSIPKAVVEEYVQEKKRLQFHFEKAVKSGDQKTAQGFRLQQRELYESRIEKQLDAGRGSCWMRDKRIAEIVANAISHFDGDRYRLHAWCVMPNHVHVLLTPLPGWELSKITHSWKSFSATAANRVLGRRGNFWREESYDHLVRDEEDFLAQKEYVLANPEKAGLKNWKWVFCEGDER